MPSKYGFGNTRKKSPYKLNRAMYGMDQKNPMVGTMDQENPIMKKETLPGINTELDAKKSPVKALTGKHHRNVTDRTSAPQKESPARARARG